MGSKKVVKKKVLKVKQPKVDSTLAKIEAVSAELERVKILFKRALTEGPAALIEL